MVYIDNMNAPFGRMIMCHMVADTTQELLEMADKIGVARKWIQDAGEYSEHFDVSLGAKKKALALGAKEITMKEFARICNLRPNAPAFMKKMQEEIDSSHPPQNNVSHE